MARREDGDAGWSESDVPTTTINPSTGASTGYGPERGTGGYSNPGGAPSNPGVMLSPRQRQDYIRELLFTGQISLADMVAGVVQVGPTSYMRLPQPLLRREITRYEPTTESRDFFDWRGSDERRNSFDFFNWGGPRRPGPARPGERLSQREMLSMLYSMNDDQLTTLQMRMWEAGFYESDVRPDWGVADAATQGALQQLMYVSLERPRATLDEILDEFSEGRITARAAELDAERAAQVQQLEAELGRIQIEQQYSTETIEEVIETLSKELFGEDISDEATAELIARLQAEQGEGFQAQRDAVFQNAMAGFNAMDSIPGLDAFMAAIAGKESGGKYDSRNPSSGAFGKYQILPSNWAAWARAAGLPGDAPQTPENQEIVARNQISTYYRQFGNWRDVAIAWYAGPGRVASSFGHDASQGAYPTIAQYADDVIARMGEFGGMSADAMLADLDGYSIQTIDAFDLQAETSAALKAMDPVGYASHSYANQANEFLSLVSGSIPGSGL